jgi:hypothetical protein
VLRIRFWRPLELMRLEREGCGVGPTAPRGRGRTELKGNLWSSSIFRLSGWHSVIILQCVSGVGQSGRAEMKGNLSVITQHRVHVWI